MGKPGLGGWGSPLPWLADSGPQAKEKELDFGNVVVNSQQSRLLVLHNEGNCTLDYRLFLEQHSPESISKDPLGTGLGWGWGQGGGHWLRLGNQTTVCGQAK